MQSPASDIQLCVNALTGGGVVAYPTEAVWGLGCNPFAEGAVTKVLSLKQRPANKGLILASGQVEHFNYLLEELDQSVASMIQASWPSHTTWLVPHHGKVPELIHGDSDKVAIRVSEHPILAALSKGFGGAIVSTSANIAGEPAAENVNQAQKYFAGSDVIFAPGLTGGRNRASKIIDALTGEVLRD